MEIKSYLYIDELFYKFFLQNLLEHGYKEIKDGEELVKGSFSIKKFKSDEFVRSVSVLEREGHENESEEFTGDNNLAMIRIPTVNEIWQEKLKENMN